MINVLRKNQKGLWIVIGLLCIPFVFYFSNSKVGPMGSNQFGKIYGRAIPLAEFQRSVRLFNLARELGMYTFLQEMVAGAQSQNEAYSDFTWNRLVLAHEAERLGIQPTAGEMAQVVKDLQAFHGANGFDLAKYNEFVQNVLPSMGFTEAQLEELAADQLTLKRVREIVGLGVQMPESESRENYERAYGKLDVAVVRLRTAEIGQEVQVSDEDIAKYYEAHKAELKSEEKRKVMFVDFSLSEEEKKLAGKERVEVLQKLADRANDFNQAVLEKGADFAQVAAKFQLPIKTTADFARSAPDPLLKSNPQLAAAAFRLTAEEPNSEAVQVSDGFYILHLGGVQPSQPLSLEEAKPQIVSALKQERVQQLLASKGAEAAAKLREALKAGALDKAGVALEKIPPFALADPPTRNLELGKNPAPETPDLQSIKSAVAELHPGEVSDLIPTPTGGIVAVLEKREPLDPAAEQSGRKSFDERFLQGKQEVAFYEWLRERRREAGVQMHAAGAGEVDAG